MSTSRFERMLKKFCQQRAATVLSPCEAEALESYLLRLAIDRQSVTRVRRSYDWEEIALAAGIELPRLKQGRHVLAPVLDAIEREFPRAGNADRREGQTSAVATPAAPEEVTEELGGSEG